MLLLVGVLYLLGGEGAGSDDYEFESLFLVCPAQVCGVAETLLEECVPEVEVGVEDDDCGGAEGT